MTDNSIKNVLKQSKSQKKSLWKWLIFIIIIGTICFGVWNEWFKKTETITEYIPKVASVEIGNIENLISSDGKIIIPETSNLSFSIGGILEEIYVEEGDEIKKGDLIAQINSQDLQFALQNAQSDLTVVLQNITSKKADLTDLDLISAQNDILIAQIKADQQIEIAERNLQVLKKNIENEKTILSLESKNTGDSADLLLQKSVRDYDSTVASIENKLNSALQSKTQALQSAQVSLNSLNPTLEEVLKEVDYLFGFNQVYPTKDISAVFSYQKKETTVKNLFEKISYELENDSVVKINQENPEEAKQLVLSEIQEQEAILNDSIEMIETILDLFQNATPNSEISSSDIASGFSNMQSQMSKLISKKENLVQIIQKIDTSFLNYETTQSESQQSLATAKLNFGKTMKEGENSDISKNLNSEIKESSLELDLEIAEIDFENLQKTIENDLLTAELKLENVKKNTQKSEINKNSSLNILNIQLQQARLKIEQAQHDLSLTTLYAPSSGTVIGVNASIGESIQANASSDNAFINIARDGNFSAEVYVEELDIAKIKLKQKTKITLDALPDTELIGTVEYISSISNSDNNGVVTYLVRVEIDDLQGAPIHEGMTTYVDFIVDQALDVAWVPSSSIVNENFVLTSDNTRVPVRVGITDGARVEIMSGLSKDDKIITNPPQDKRSGGADANGGGNGGTRNQEGITERLKEIGLSESEIEEVQSGEMSDEVKAKMQKLREESGAQRQTGGPGGGGGRP